MSTSAASVPSLPANEAGRSSASIGLLAMAVAIMSMAWSPLIVRSTDVGPAASAFWRLIFAMPLLIAWSRSERIPFGAAARRGPLTGEGLLAAIVAGVLFAADLAFFHAALPLTSVANASLLGNLAPVLAVFAGIVVFGEKLRPSVIVALMISLAGLLITSGFIRHGFTIRQGDLLAVLAALSYGAYLVALRAARATRTAANVTLVSSVVAAIVLFLLAVVDGTQIVPQTLQGWAAVILLGVLCQVLGQGLAAVGIGRLSSGMVALFLLANPVLSAILAWLVFGESLGSHQIIGGALILAAVVIARR